MSDNDALEIYKQHRAAYDKYSYVLLAIAASAVAFVVQKSEGHVLSWEILPLGLSVVSFGLSFWCGVRGIERVIATLGATYHLILFETGTHPDQLSEGDPTAGPRRAVTQDTNKATTYSRWQYRFLIIGSVLFLTWHILITYQATLTAAGDAV